MKVLKDWEKWTSTKGTSDVYELELGQVSLVLKDSPMGWLYKIYGAGTDPNETLVPLKTKNLKTAKRRAMKRGTKMLKAQQKKLQTAINRLGAMEINGYE